jgi:type IV secretion system protein VirD4
MKDKFNNAVGPQVRVDKPKAGQLIPVLAVVFKLAGLQSATQFFAQEYRLCPHAIFIKLR